MKDPDSILYTSFIMNANDLFSFLDDNAQDAQIEEDQKMQTDDRPNSPPLKRKDPPTAAPAAQTEEESDKRAIDEDSTMGDGPSSSKKQRLSSPKPVVLDDFETEAKREVAASAGLTGSVESGSRLELRHQVRSSSLSLTHPSTEL